MPQDAMIAITCLAILSKAQGAGHGTQINLGLEPVDLGLTGMDNPGHPVTS